MRQFLNGALFAASLAISLFFLRFWRTTHDQLFLCFALAFVVLGLHWAVMASEFTPLVTGHQSYLPRLVAFGLIIAGVIGKNRQRDRP